jgi:hypothetical protein
MRAGLKLAERSSIGETSAVPRTPATSRTISAGFIEAASSGVGVGVSASAARLLAVSGTVLTLSGCATLFGGGSDPGVRLVGQWRLDSLAFYALRRDLPESTKRLLERYRQTTGTASRQFRTGEVVITTRYRADSTYEHTVATRDPAQRDYRERGRWRIDPLRGRLWCRNEAAQPCPHDRAVVERVTDRELILHLELTGRDTGLAEYFRLVRANP